MPEQGISERELRKTYMRVFYGGDGSIVYKDLCNRLFKHSTPFVPGDSEGTFVNVGMQRALLHIEEMMSDEGIKDLVEPEEGEA